MGFIQVTKEKENYFELVFLPFFDHFFIIFIFL